MNQQLRRQLQEKADPVLAAQLFSLEVTPLPGVAIPAGRREPTMSGTYAGIQLLAVFDKLTAAQREAAAPFVGLVPFSGRQKDLSAFTPPAFTLPGARGSAAWLGGIAPGVVAAGFVPLGASPAPSDEDLLRAFFLPIFKWANGAIAQLLGRSTSLPDKFDLEFFSDPSDAFALTTDFAIQCLTAWNLNCRTDDPNHPGQRTTAAYYDLERRRANCHTSLNVAKFKGLPIEVIQSIVTHEVFHCYQDKAIASLAQLQTVGDWLIDGEATWVQNRLVPGAVFSRMNDIWREYLQSPKGHLFERGYPALGFFGHLSDVAGRDHVAATLLDGFVRGVNGNDDAYSVLVGQHEDRFLDTWAPSYFLSHHDAFLWDARGPGDKSNIPGSGASPEIVRVGAGASTPLPSVAKWELGLVRLESPADIIEVTMDAGHLSLIDATEKANVPFADGEPIRFCNIDKCTCPADTDGEVPATRPGRAPFDIGMTAGRQRAAAHARGYTLSDYCKKRENDPAGGTAGGAGGSGTSPEGGTGWDPPTGWEVPHGKATSDPHIATIDGRWFDLQAIGEFVLSRSTVDDFQVQVRFGTRANDRTWSTPVAMATHAGKDRIVISLNLAAAEPVPVLRVNGKVVDPNRVTLDGAAIREVATQWGSGYAITFSDGTRVGANLTSREGLSTWVNPSAARRGKLTGLLGNADGDKSNDPVSRDGNVLGETPSYDELYQVFGNSWRIKQTDSLFDYSEGETTATMTDVTYPDRTKPAPAPTVLASAQQLCAAGGVTDVDLLRNCAFDVAATGNKRYVSSYQSDQRRVAYALTLRGTGTVSRQPSAGTTRDIVIEGKVTDATKPVSATFTAGKGDIIYIDPRNCVDFRFSDLRGPDGKALVSNSMAAMAGLCGTRYTLPADGSYRLTTNIFSDRAGDYRYPIVAVRPDRVRSIAPGGVMEGTIGMRAERDVYVLTVKDKTKVSFETDGCAGNFDVAVMFGDNESVTAGSQCRLGTIELPKAGSYQFIFNPFSTLTGAYRIRLKQE